MLKCFVWYYGIIVMTLSFRTERSGIYAQIIDCEYWLELGTLLTHSSNKYPQSTCMFYSKHRSYNVNLRNPSFTMKKQVQEG